MAEYPTSKLDKALAQRASTSTSRPTWQERMPRFATVPAGSLQAPEVIRGFAGSWAAHFDVGTGMSDTYRPESPAPIQRQVSHLGQPGVPEINFRPYDWGTTCHGKYGPSLLGHPVSFEVVGPTAKSPHLLHQWLVNASGASDVLTLDSCTWRSTLVTPEVLPVGLNSIEEIYGISSIPEEGLYLVVSLTGASGALADAGGGLPGFGGIGDGLIGHDNTLGVITRVPITTPDLTGQRSKYEVFRVVNMDATSLTLDSGKRLADHFSLPILATQVGVIRAVMLVKPAAARLVAVPGSGARGKEQVFAFVPPKQSLTSDHQPPASVATTSGELDPWLGYAATSSPAIDYPVKNALPVPKVIRQGKGRLTGIFGEAPISAPAGRMTVILKSGTTIDAANDVGRIVRIHHVTRFRDASWSVASVDGGSRVGDPELDHLLGFWEIVGAGAGATNFYQLRMVPQVDPESGVPFYGTTEYLRMAQTGKLAGQEVQLQWTLHEPVSSLWTGYAQPEMLESARLKHLIDPVWVQASLKNIDLADTEAALARPDRAVFATGSSNGGADGSNENPGNLMDLGFRAVFFPAKVSSADPTKLVPDFDRPLTSNELVLDPSSDEAQYLEVDYSSGLVHLSHAPVAGAGCDLAPSAAILTNAENPRGEMVFFASFVPFSQEPGQRSPAPRVTGGQLLSGGYGTSCTDAVESADLYGQRRHWPLATGQTFVVGTTTEIKLDVQLTAVDLPPTGFIELAHGFDVPLGPTVWSDGAGNRISTLGYTEVEYQDVGNGGNTTLKGVFGGGVSGVSTITTSSSLVLSAILRRDIVTPNKDDGTTGTSFLFDSTYGHNKRAGAVRFKRARVSQGIDGSLEVDTRDPMTEDHRALFSDMFSSWVLSGGEMTSVGLGGGFGRILGFAAVTVVIDGVRTTVPAQQVSLGVDAGPPADAVVYLDGSAPGCPVYRSGPESDLSNPAYILMGAYTHNGADILTYTDLRYPMVDIDKRLDVTVGRPEGHAQPADTHFATLAEAVTYVTTIGKMTPRGQYRRIKVIGPTTENSAQLPIRPQAQGLIIEGAGRRLDGTPIRPQEITWGGAAAPALFDLSGCDGIVFRDLAFRFDDDGTTSVVPRERCLFTCDYTDGGDALEDAVFENIRLHGPAHGFFYCNDDLDPAAGFRRVTFRNCVAKELTDFGILTGDTVTPASYVVVDNCWFQVRSVLDVTGPELGGVLTDRAIIKFNNDGAVKCTIQNSTLLGSTHGVFLGGSGHLISHNTIFGTDQIGIVLYGRESVVEHNHLESIHKAAPTLLAFRTAIYLTVAGTYNRFLANEVDVDTPTGPEYALYANDNGTDAILYLYGNNLTRPVRTGPYAVVQGNTIVDELTVGAHSKVVGNEVTVSIGTGDVSLGIDCVLQGTEIAGVVTAGTDARLSGNLVQGAGTTTLSDRTQSDNDVFDGPVTFNNTSSFLGCVFNGGVNDSGVTASATRFLGCHLTFAAGAILDTDEVVFQGNYFNFSGTPTIEIDGIQNILDGNFFKGSGHLYLRDTGGAARTGFVVNNNYMAGSPQGGIYLVGNYCTVEGNVFNGYEASSATPLLYGAHVAGSGNIVEGNILTVGLRVTGTGVLVRGNQVGSEAASFEATDGSYKGNFIADTLTASGNDSLYEGNHVVGVATLSGTNCHYMGNFFEDAGSATVFSGGSSQYQNNDVVGETAISGDEIGLKNNTFWQTVTAGGAGLQQDFVGNTFKSLWLVGGADSIVESTLTGNHCDLGVNFGGAASLVDCTVQGNIFKAAFTAQASVRTTFSGNRHGGDVDISGSTEPVFQGNWVGVVSTGAAASLDMRTCDDYICMGNKITGTLYITSGAGATACGIVMGNRAATITDGAAGAAPTNYQITMGNKVSNAAGTIYGAAPATTTVNTNNIRDDA